MASLDRSRPFGTVIGDDQGRLYEQDGHFFSADGKLWKPPAEQAAAPAPAAASAPSKPRAKPAAAAAAADDQLAAQLGGE